MAGRQSVTTNVEREKQIAEEAWHRGLHMRDTEVAELRAENARLQQIAGQSIREQSDLTQQLLALRAAAQKVIDDPLLNNASEWWGELREALDGWQR